VAARPAANVPRSGRDDREVGRHRIILSSSL
jgi:hypothetical protein